MGLGEKLRIAREQRGISISEVAEQTRISPLYLEAIEEDNYKSLPGGIFNKGFVRSYAKYVGIDEQEALQDYSRLIAETAPNEENEFKTYRPEVLTDDRAASSIIPTVIFAAIILGLMSAGILFLLNYIQNQQSQPPIAANAINSNAAGPANRPANTAVTPADGGVPAMGSVRVEFKTNGADIWLSSVTDGTSSSAIISADKPVTFEPKQNLRLSYSKSLAQAAQLAINGKPITLPPVPANPRRQLIEVELNNNNVATVWQNGSYTFDTPAPAAEETPSGAAQPAAPRSSPRRPANPGPPSRTNTAPASPPTMTNRSQARPAATPNRPPANTDRQRP